MMGGTRRTGGPGYWMHEASGGRGRDWCVIADSVWAATVCAVNIVGSDIATDEEMTMAHHIRRSD